jgi:arsenate reductase
MAKQSVLFICVHNSARSQMAAALMNRICGQFFEAESAGLQPGTINPLAVAVLKEVGIDISKNRPQSVDDVLKSGKIFDLVVTVCSEAEAEGCPFFPGATRRLHWPFEDPARFTGSNEQRLENTRRVRDQIREKLEIVCGEDCAAGKR